MATNEPMTDERLHEIDALQVFLDETEVDEAQEALRDLLLEVRRLRAREQALEAENAAAIDELEWQREINQQLGAENEQKQAMIDAMRPMVEALRDYAGLKRYADFCEWCGAQGQSVGSHTPDCLVTAAATFLTKHPATSTTAAGEAVADR